MRDNMIALGLWTLMALLFVFSAAVKPQVYDPNVAQSRVEFPTFFKETGTVFELFHSTNPATGHVATLWIQNEISNRPPESFFVTLDGMQVEIVSTIRQSDTPDTFYVLPPKDYIAVPADVVVEDGGEVYIAIYRNLLS